MKQPTLLALFALAALAPRPSWASDLRPHVGVDLGFNARSEAGVDTTTWSPNVAAYARIGDELGLSLDWGLTAVDARTDGSGVKPLNPFVAVHVAPDLGGAVRLRVGLGATLPIAEAGSPGEETAFRTARALRGGWDPWLYRPDTFSLAVPLRLEIAALEPLTLAAEGAVFLHIGTAAGADEVLGVQGAAEAAFRLGFLDLGARLQAVRYESDEAQVSIEPFARLNVGPVGVQARLTMNLDDPSGFAFERSGIWGAHLGVAYYY